MGELQFFDFKYWHIFFVLVCLRKFELFWTRLLKKRDTHLQAHRSKQWIWGPCLGSRLASFSFRACLGSMVSGHFRQTIYELSRVWSEGFSVQGHL